METLTCRKNITHFCNFVSIVETMLCNIETPKVQSNEDHRYIIVESSLLNNLIDVSFKFDKIHSCYMNRKIERLNIKLDYKLEEDAIYDAVRCNFTDPLGKYIVVKV